MSALSVLATAVVTTPAVAALDTPQGLLGEQITAWKKAEASGKPVEVISARTENSTTFVLPDGKLRMEMSSGPTRVKQNDLWQDIDTTLELRDGKLRPKAATAEVEISAGGDTTIATLEQGHGKKFGIKWSRTLPKPEVSGNVATYKNVVEGGDLVVTALPTGLAHDVVLNRPPTGPVEIPMPVQLDNLAFSTSKEGRLLLSNPGTREVLASAPQPKMFDAAAADNPDAGRRAQVKTEIRKSTGDDITLVLKPDTGFLADPNVQYPVTIDPWTTLALKTDTFVSTDYTTGQSGATWLHAGKFGSGAKTARTYLKFDASRLLGAKISNADLRMWNYKSNACGTNVASGIQVRRVTAFWRSAELSLDKQPPTTATGAVTNKGSYGFTGCDPGELFYSIESIVQEWANGTPAYGLQMRAANETDATNWRMFTSAENTDTAHKPKLVVDYTPRPVQAEVVDTVVNMAWPAHAAGNYSLLDERTGQVVWSGATTNASVSLDETGFTTLVVRAGGTAIAKVIAVKAMPELGLPPMTVITSPSATNMEWIDAANTSSEEPFNLSGADATDEVVLTDPAAQVNTPLGATKAYSIDTGLAEQAETEPANEFAEENDPEPQPAETDEGIAVDGADEPVSMPGGGIKPVYNVEVTPPLTAEEIEDATTPLPQESSASTTRSDQPPSEPAEAESPSKADEQVEKSGQQSSIPVAAEPGSVTPQAVKRRITQSWTTYEAYIAAKDTGGPPIPYACDNSGPTEFLQWRYAGDNRGPAFNSGKYRTRVAIKYDWARRQIVGYRDTHTTKRYKFDDNKRPYRIQTKKAPLTGIKVTRGKITETSARGRIDHASHNPFCKGGDIDYTNHQWVWRTGRYLTIGLHDQMPDHEMYRQDIYDTGERRVRRVFTHKMKHLLCLVPEVCPMRFYRYTG